MMDFFDNSKPSVPAYKLVSRNYDAAMPQHILLLDDDCSPEPIVPCLSCVRLKKGNRITIKLLLRFHAAE